MSSHMSSRWSARPATTSQLVVEARGGCPAAEAQLFEAFHPLMLAVARSHRLDDDDSADVAQVTWLKAMQGLPSLIDVERFPGWLRTIARNESVETLRRRKRERPCRDEVLAVGVDRADRDGPLAPDLEVIGREDVARLRAALALLSPEDRRLIALLFDEDRSYLEVSAVLGCAVGSIGPTRMRVLNRLRQMVQQVPFPTTVVATTDPVPGTTAPTTPALAA